MLLSYARAASTLVLLAWLCAASAAAECNLVFPPSPIQMDSRYQYDWYVLRTALNKTTPQYGPCTMRPSTIPMGPARVTQELATPAGRINIFVRATSLALEKQFLPIRIPVDKGLLGYRIFLVRSDDLERFSRVRDLQDLRPLRVGQGKDWADVAVLRAAGITVIEGANYEGLFGMLTAGRFDYFSRAVDEALRELDEHRASHPQLALEPGILLHYPLPRYFFVRRDAEGTQLAQRILAGLEMMIRDGTLDQLFRRYKGKTIERANLLQRRLIQLRNPELSPETPLSRSELWYDPWRAGAPR
ncbi:ABC transporter substrate-binding protein [Duganella sp. HH105]|uniref:substrate-binding periplasmic protein n=1 Tax=Duganella sp. HH105 TaxID=1781067 RepID=UPI000877C8A4|nr:hypothetical protein [Duganella sp. HH105]OEZ63574.1 hypothetical protein DUGA6_00750 [Duganella sp. HH105]